ncbi:MAG: tetratricopeptide repeat protein, partial [Cellvibrionales bacterium]|nr:tetratricopeptide repeat protein [Cellvibrionales bacterium]
MVFLRLFIILTLFWLETTQAKTAAEQKLTYSKTSLENLLQAHFALYQQAHDLALDLFLIEAIRHKDQRLLEESIHLALAKQNPKALISATHQWVALIPNNSKALFFHSVAYAYNGKLATAIQVMRQAEKQGAVTDYTWLVSLSDKAIEKEQQQAIEWLGFAETKACDNFDAILALSLLLTKTGQTENVPLLLDKALIFGQHHPSTFAISSGIYLSLNQADKAQDALQQGVNLHPRQYQLRFQLAQLLEDNAPNNALAHYEFLHYSSPHNAQYIQGIANTHKRLKQPNDALAWLMKLAETQYKNQAYLQMAEIASAQSQNQQALNHLRSIDTDKQNDQVKAKIIKLLIKLGQTKEARQLLKRLLKEKRESNAPQLIVYQMLWIDLLEQQNQPKKAFKQLNRWLNEHPDEPLFLLKSALLASTFMTPKDFKNTIQGLLQKTAFKTSLLERIGEFLAKQTQKD